jgi:signal peptidase I
VQVSEGMKYKKPLTTVLGRNGTDDSSPTPISENRSICGYIGPSMNPTLTAQDLLEITPYATDRKPRVGDVILFRPPQHDYKVVHRIVSISSRVIRTRGDNCCEIDPWHLDYTNIDGQVVGASYGNRYRSIFGGLPGKLFHWYCQLRRWCLVPVVDLLGPIYRLICTKLTLQRFIPARLKPRIVIFNSGSNSTHKLLLGRKVIGTYDPILSQWQIGRPYRLLVNASTLMIPR